MMYAKSVLAGIVAVAAASMACYIPMLLLWLRLTAQVSPGSGDSYFFVTHWHTLRILCVAIPVFAAGFLWQYRRGR